MLIHVYMEDSYLEIQRFFLFFLYVYCGIMRIRVVLIFVEFVRTPHPRIYILNEITSKIKFLLNT